MLDIKYIRDNAQEVKKAAKHKGVEVDIDKLLEVDQKRVDLQRQLDKLRAEKNKASKEITQGGDKDLIISKMKGVDQELAKLEAEFKNVESDFRELMWQVPNIPSADTPIGKDESDNKVIRKWGKPVKQDFEPLDHVELGKRLDIIDIETSAKVSGARFNYLKGAAALLEFALIQHALRVLTKSQELEIVAKNFGLKDVSLKPFVPVIPPVMVKPEILEQMARLEPKDDRFYIKSDDLYLVGSAEHTLGPIHLNETLNEDNLPLRYVGFSTAFRREAGSYGKDTRGILRVHQFDKLEIESFTIPEDSLQEQDFIVAIQEYLMQSLELSYQVVQICTGDMGGPDARQIDIETWLPSQGKYRETHTSDLMNDYQARRLNTRVKRADKQTEFVHMNDATAFAIGRTLIAILENYQQADGSVKIPKVLVPYVGFENITPS